MIKFVGFDKDGTLIDDVPGYMHEWGRILSNDFGVDVLDAEKIFMDYIEGPTALQLRKILEKNNIHLSEKELFRKSSEIAYALGKNFKGGLFPDVLNSLRVLKDNCFHTFVSSGQQERITHDDLQRTGLTEYIDYFVGIRPEEPEFKKGEPHFRAAAKHFNIPFSAFITEAVFIDDTVSGIDSAKTLGMIGIGRLGTISEEALLSAGARMAVWDFTVLPEILKAL